MIGSCWGVLRAGRLLKLTEIHFVCGGVYRPSNRQSKAAGCPFTTLLEPVSCGISASEAMAASEDSCSILCESYDMHVVPQAAIRIP